MHHLNYNSKKKKKRKQSCKSKQSGVYEQVWRLFFLSNINQMKFLCENKDGLIFDILGHVDLLSAVLITH